jgi:hypothetical protein
MQDPLLHCQQQSHQLQRQKKSSYEKPNTSAVSYIQPLWQDFQLHYFQKDGWSLAACSLVVLGFCRF